MRERSSGLCEICGLARADTMHHRLTRKYGPWDPTNIVHLCGDGTRGCHGRITNTRNEYYDRGWLIRTWDQRTPAEIPFLHHAWGSVYLDALGDYHHREPEGTTMTDLNIVLHLIEHAERWQIKDKRFTYLSCNGLGMTLTLPHGEVGLFHQWVRELGGRTIVARRDLNHPGQLEASGTLVSGNRVSVLVELDRRLLIDAKMLGRVELTRVEQMARELNPETVPA
ncbi:hypothetical protein [Amycolatopsis sp. NPDC051128]|uniref:hypothetical protein n=1 Tax=Amycolatopsis sp. NPDC051128 TaxID=3155412 RepID=UPI003438BFEB